VPALLTPNRHQLFASVGAGKLCLVPLEGVMQLRPTFDHVDEATRKQNDADLAESDMPQPEEDDPVPVQVVFKRRETERAVAARERSYAHLRVSLGGAAGRGWRVRHC